MPHGPEWRGYQSPNSEPDGVLDLFANANKVSFTYDVPGQGLETVSFALNGSNAATKRTYDCVQNPSAAAQSAPVAPAQPAAQPAAQSRPEWVENPSGQLSLDMVMAGTMPDGMPVFVCTAPYNGGYHAGLTGMWTSDTCNIGYGGQEQRVAPYQVLKGQGQWQGYNGTIPANAMDGGFEASGEILYVCRATYNNAVLAGKFRQGFQGCHVADGGREVEVAAFDLLTY